MDSEKSVCKVCPRACGADRDKGEGFCAVGRLPVVAKAYLHMWEEPCISGVRGSGTVFFTGCNLKCVYCQNHEISQEGFGKPVTVEELGKIFMSLQEKGAHNINLVSPSHYVEAIRECLSGTDRLKIPVIYNSSGYDSLNALGMMEGLVDVYLPDLKYFKSETGLKYSGAGDYFKVASSAILEMYKQAGAPVLDPEGIIRKGLIIRHLILPGMARESMDILTWIRDNLPGGVYISLMSQYTPCFKAALHPEIDRRITRREYELVVNHFIKLGFENGYMQERDSAREEYIPDFDLEGVEKT